MLLLHVSNCNAASGSSMPGLHKAMLMCSLSQCEAEACQSHSLHSLGWCEEQGGGDS